MSGHNKWSTIKNKKAKTDAAKGKIFTKIGREIAIAVREGGADPDSNSKLRELIHKYGLEPEDIELEITESICGEESGNIFDMIRELQTDGFRIAMDDFGSGYSSLNMLKEMPLDIIKMDLKFLDGEGEKSQLILKALIDMAHTMELSVVVEGVELPAQVEFLRQFKNCCLQGYYYSRPVTPDVFEAMLKKN